MASVNKVILVGNCGRDPEIRYLPSGAGTRLLESDATGSVLAASDATALGPWQGYGVLLAWVAAVLAVAAVLLRRRDA